MKIVKVIAVVLAALVAAVLIGPAFIGQSFEVEKSIVVAAPASKPYALLAELRAWEDWNYWSNEDDTMTLEYAASTSGPGASYTWAGKDGAGTTTIVSVDPDKSVGLELDFGDRGKGDVLFTLTEADGQTRVNWHFSGAAQGYMGRWFNVMIGPMMQKPMTESLAKIKELTEAA